MNNGNFNASELPIVYDLLNQMRQGFDSLELAGCGGVVSDESKIANMVRSEDSYLADTWSKSSTLALEFGNKAGVLLTKISEAFEQYIKDTLGNEGDTARVIAGVNSQLEADKEALDQIEI